MKQPESVRAFKNELRNYRFYIERAVELEDKIEFLYDRLGGVRGIDPSKEPLHIMPNRDIEWKIRDDISKLDAQMSLVRAKIRYVDQILAKMEEPVKTAIICVYIDKKKTDVVAVQMWISPSGLMKKMNKAIEEALDG
jgi:hypothetical protein